MKTKVSDYTKALYIFQIVQKTDSKVTIMRTAVFVVLVFLLDLSQLFKVHATEEKKTLGHNKR